MELNVALQISKPKLNPRKFQSKVKQVTSIEHLLSGNGIDPHAIVDLDPPQDVKGVQRFLGMCNYLSRLILTESCWNCEATYRANAKQRSLAVVLTACKPSNKPNV